MLFPPLASGDSLPAVRFDDEGLDYRGLRRAAAAEQVDRRA